MLAELLLSSVKDEWHVWRWLAWLAQRRSWVRTQVSSEGHRPRQRATATGGNAFPLQRFARLHTMKLLTPSLIQKATSQEALSAALESIQSMSGSNLFNARKKINSKKKKTLFWRRGERGSGSQNINDNPSFNPRCSCGIGVSTPMGPCRAGALFSCCESVPVIKQQIFGQTGLGP